MLYFDGFFQESKKKNYVNVVKKCFLQFFKMDYRLIILAIFSLSKFESFIFNRILVFLVFKTKVTIGILRFSGKKFVKIKVVFSVLFTFQKVFPKTYNTKL